MTVHPRPARDRRCPSRPRATQAVASPRDDRVLATTRWVSAAVVPVLVAAFVILYLFPRRTMVLWGWMVCPSMSALIMGAGYLSGAYLFTRTALVREWHRVEAGFLATTVFSTMLLATTILHWDSFNHDHVSFWTWLVLYAATPVLLPVLSLRNRRRDPRRLDPGDVAVPRLLRVAIGVGGALQLGIAAWMFAWPGMVAERWPWGLNAVTCRSLSAFVAFPAVTWLLFILDRRWSSFRITQQTVTLGLALITVGAMRARGDFVRGAHGLYVAALVVALAINVVLFVAMERRARRRPRRDPNITKERNSAETSATCNNIVDLDGAVSVAGERRTGGVRERAGVGQT